MVGTVRGGGSGGGLGLVEDVGGGGDRMTAREAVLNGVQWWLWGKRGWHWVFYSGDG